MNTAKKIFDQSAYFEQANKAIFSPEPDIRENKIQLSEQNQLKVFDEHNSYLVRDYRRKQAKRRGQKGKSSFLKEKIFRESYLRNKKKDLNGVLKKHKIKNLVQNFAQKINRNITNSSPIEFNPYDHQYPQGSHFLQIQGFRLPKHLDFVLQLLCVLQIFCAFLIYAMTLLYNNQLQHTTMFQIYQYSSLFVLAIEIICKTICKKIKGDKKLQTIREISLDYLKGIFIIDFLCLAILVVDITIQWETFKFLRLAFLLKIKELYHKLLAIESHIVNNFQKQQYWGVAKIFFMNFFFAHIIAILLAGIAEMSPMDNWMKKIGVDSDPWNQKYAWSYYWAMSTMLGFGNATPANYKEAIYISLVECISCILLAYNINQVGILLTNIMQQNSEKQKNLKTSRRLAEENNISDDLYSKMNNYIRQNDSVKKKFMLEVDKQFISSLPSEMKGEFLKQANKYIFNKLFFFHQLSKKTLLSLAERIQIKIAHPEQIIFNSKTDDSLLVLKSGEVGVFTLNPGSAFNKALVDKVTISKKQDPKLLHLRFFHNDPLDPHYCIKALDYSIIYTLEKDQIINILKEFPSDFQKFCELRDQSNIQTDFYETISCEYCKTNHSKIKCPKLHYIPFKSMVSLKYLQEMKRQKTKRQNFYRLKRYSQQKSLNVYIKIFKKVSKGINTCKTVFSQKKVPENPSQIKQQINMSLQRFFTSEASQLMGQHRSSIQLLSKVGLDESKLLERLENRLQNIIKEHDGCELSNFWDIQCDKLHDFGQYFAHGNPSNLQQVLLCLTCQQNLESIGFGHLKIVLNEVVRQR